MNKISACCIRSTYYIYFAVGTKHGMSLDWNDNDNNNNNNSNNKIIILSPPRDGVSIKRNTGGTVT